MIWFIAQKEFLQNLKTLRFSLFLIFSVILVLLSTFISIRNYESRLTEHLNVEDYQQEKKGEGNINRKPEVLSILARGTDRRMGNSIPIHYANAPFKASSHIGHFSQRMRFMSEFSDIDFAFIVQVIFSLLAIILVYDTISGERAHGQLRLILSNSVPRANLLVGKFIGNALCLLLPYGSCFVLGLLIVQLSPNVQLTSGDWARIAIMFVISALYLLAFLNLGTLVSCKTRIPALSLLILLSLWIWLIVVHPKLSVFAAKKFAPVTSEARMEQQLRQAYEDYQQKRQKDQKGTGGRYGLLLLIQKAKDYKKLYDNFLNQFAQQAQVADFLSKKIILRRELLHYLISFRFLVLLAMSAVLFLVNGFEFVDSYQRDLSTYSFRVVDEWNRRNTTGTVVYKKPNPLRFCAIGEEQVQTKYLGITAGEGVTPPQPSMFYDNDKLPDVKSIDWSFIIKVIFSLFGIILVFDSISGEKERGTLRLICSNSVPRHQILLGKYLAAMITVTIPLIWGMLISLLITGLSSSFMLTGQEFLRIFLLIGISLIYISLIVLMSLSVSSIAHQSVTSLLILLFTLILMVMIIPNVAGILAGEFSKTTSDYQLVKMRDSYMKEVAKEEDELRRQVREGILKTKEEIVQKFRKLSWKYFDNWFQLLYDHLQSINTQIKLARDLAKISPSAVFQYTTESLANSGPLSEEHFFQSARRYRSIYSDYVKSKVGELVRVSHGYTVTMPDGSKMEIPGTAPKEYDGDMSDFPKFVMPPIPIKDSIKASGWNITILILWNIVLFLIAHVAFLKYDIR